MRILRHELTSAESLFTPRAPWRSLLKGANGDRAWENRPGGVPNSSMFLELADLALGLKKPEPRKKKAAAGNSYKHQNRPIFPARLTSSFVTSQDYFAAVLYRS